MKKSHILFILSLLLLPTFYQSTTYAQDEMQLSLPDDATARLGKGRLHEIKYSPDGTRLAVVSSIGIWLYDTSSNTEISLLTKDNIEIFCTAFSEDGAIIAGGSVDGTIYLWNTATGTFQRKLTGHTNVVYSVAFSSDETTLASGAADTTVRFVELHNR